MGVHHPTRGSMGYSPRKRAESIIPKFSSWPEIEGGPKLQGFAGYKVGMTHAFVVDSRPHSTTSGMEIQVPVTVIEVPPMKVAGIRLYQQTNYGLKTVMEAWSKKLDKELNRVFPVPKEYDAEETLKKLDAAKSDEVRIVGYTQPSLVSGVPKKKPDVMELRVGGGSIEQRVEYAKSLLGKEVKITEFTSEGKLVDVAAITKGRGFQGHVKRWGVKLQPRKNSKHRRMIGTLGPHFPSYVLPTVPQAGQMGYHQRTEYNKRVLKISDNGGEITPAGGFLHYGTVRSSYIMIHGSIPGPPKRLVGLRDPVRPKDDKAEKIEITYISKESKQGV